MSEQISDLNKQNNPSADRNVWIKNSYVYNLSMLLFASVILITLSFAIFPLISTKLFGELKYSLGYSSYYSTSGPIFNLLFSKLFTSILLKYDFSLFWLNVVFRQIAFVGVSLWGIVSLARGKKRVCTVLYTLVALILHYLSSIIFLSVRFLRDPFFKGDVGKVVVGFLRDYKTVIFFLMMVSAILCAIFLAKRLNSNPAPKKPAKTDIEGIGGWLIISIIRFVGSGLNYLLLLVLAVLASLGVKGIVGFGGSPVFTYLHWNLSLLLLFIIVFAIFVLVALIGKKRAFPAMAIAFETLLIALSTMFIYDLVMLTIVISGDISYIITTVVSQLIAIVWSAAFIAYYMNSDRVKNTFVK